MKIFSSAHVFRYPWEHVSASSWKKYPNEQSSHVVAIDTLRHDLDPETGVLRLERLITCKQAIPSWLLVLVGGADVSYVREVSEVDVRAKTLTLRSTNLTMNSLLQVYETVVYRPDPESPQSHTKFDQEAQITAYARFPPLCSKLEQWGVERFAHNAHKGKLGFERILRELFKNPAETREE